MDQAHFQQLATYSNRLHGHKYVCLVAVWLLENDDSAPVAQPEIRRGLVHAESNRIFEALERLVEIGAMRELPAADRRRFFERLESPYWVFVETQTALLKSAANSG